MLRSKIHHTIVVVAMGSVLAACAGAPPSESEIGAYPTAYKAIAKDHLRVSLIDPYSVRDAQIAPPKLGQIHILGTMRHESGWAICFRANAKNRMGGYTGHKPMVLLIRNNQVVGTNQDADHYDVRTICADVRYEPFPEIEEDSRRSSRS